MKDIQRCTLEHLSRYGEIYAKAFRGEPWNDEWSVEDATTHVRELLENKQSYGLECLIDGQVVGFILGTSMLFHYGRTFEINDLAVAQIEHNVAVAALCALAGADDVAGRCFADIRSDVHSAGVLGRLVAPLVGVYKVLDQSELVEDMVDKP